LDTPGCDTTLLLLRDFDIFAHITDEEYEELNLVHEFTVAAKAEYIYFPSQNHRKLYFTKKGYIKIGYIDESGNECIKEVIKPGEVFGQITLEKNNAQDEFAQAYKSEVSLCAFNIDDFTKLLQKKPALALAFSRHLGKKFRNIETRLINLLNKSVYSRLINLLLQLVSTDDANLNSAAIDRFLTHDDMAKLIGSTRQTVTSTLLQLESENLISISKNYIRIPDIKLLKNAALSDN
jgi:CRP/FNR family transcriptional regulator, cyclic AMP receptor protein